MTCWQDHISYLHNVNFLIRNLLYIDESYYLVVISVHSSDAAKCW
jgi:hypothetical protein